MTDRLQWISAPGFYPDLDADRYFDDPAPIPSLTQSVIKVLNETSPRHAAAAHPRLNPYGERGGSTKAQYLGSAVHRLALGKGRPVSVLRYPDFKSSSARQARDLAVANGRIPVLEKVHAQALEMAAILRARIEEAVQGHAYETEVPLFWIRQTAAGPIWCRGMLDVWCEALALALDVKTTAGFATEEAVGKDIASNGYDVQDSWYRDGIESIRPDLAGRARFEFLYCETSEPYGARPHELDETSRVIGRFQIDRAAEIWGRCWHGRTWPSYPRQTGSVGTPGWHQKRWSELYQQEELEK